MQLIPLFLDVSLTGYGRRKYLSRLLSFMRPESANPIKEAHENFSGFGKQLLVDVRNHVYGDLGVIDGKTNSLMQLNAIMVAVYSIAYGNLIDGKFKVVPGDVAFLISAIMLCLVAIFLLMSCIFIRWETYRSVGANVEKDLIWWIKLRDSRTIRYRIAWCANVISIVIFVALILKNYEAIVSIGLHQ